MVGVIADNLERIRAACAHSRADFDPNRSDIDVLVDFPDGMNDLFDAYMGLREDLTRILGRHVDVIMGRGVRNPLLLASLRDDAVRLHAA